MFFFQSPPYIVEKSITARGWIIGLMRGATTDFMKDILLVNTVLIYLLY